jgi:hypothetical protein
MAVEFLFDAGNLKNFSAEWSGASNDQFTTSHYNPRAFLALLNQSERFH